jgi:hypothetical protein
MAKAGSRKRRVIGIVSVAPTSEMSGQGRVLAQLLERPGGGEAIIFSETAQGAQPLRQNAVG